MENSDEAKLARVRAFKERKDAEEKQRIEKYRNETIDRIVAATYQQEPKLSFYQKSELWNRVYEYLAFKVSTHVSGDAFYDRSGKDIEEAIDFQHDVEAALAEVAEAEAKVIVARMLDEAEKTASASLQKPQT